MPGVAVMRCITLVAEFAIAEGSRIACREATSTGWRSEAKATMFQRSCKRIAHASEHGAHGMDVYSWLFFHEQTDRMPSVPAASVQTSGQ